MKISTKSIIIFLIIFSMFFIPAVQAHQPRIVKESVITQIRNPEISQAFYGELKGEPAYFQIHSEQWFKLYVGILVPDIADVDKDWSVIISRKLDDIEEEMFLLNGENYEWEYFYDEFGGDGYFKGPELRSNSEGGLPRGTPVSGGTYNVKVFSPDNQGKYVLVVGEQENFPLSEIINTAFVLPILKISFFNQSPLAIFNGLIGLYGFLPLVFLIFIIATVSWLIIRKHLKNKKLGV